jgi:hypothetical protein
VKPLVIDISDRISNYAGYGNGQKQLLLLLISDHTKFSYSLEVLWGNMTHPNFSKQLVTDFEENSEVCGGERG